MSSAPLVNVGGSLTAFTVIVKVSEGVDVSTPPLATPPLSLIAIVTVATPLAFAFGVNVSDPLGLTAGCTLKSGLLLLLITKVKV